MMRDKPRQWWQVAAIKKSITWRKQPVFHVQPVLWMAFENHNKLNAAMFSFSCLCLMTDTLYLYFLEQWLVFRIKHCSCENMTNWWFLWMNDVSANAAGTNLTQFQYCKDESSSGFEGEVNWFHDRCHHWTTLTKKSFSSPHCFYWEPYCAPLE